MVQIKNNFFKRLKWKAGVPTSLCSKQICFSLPYVGGLSKTRTKVKSKRKFIMGMKVIQSGGCKVETILTEDFPAQIM